MLSWSKPPTQAPFSLGSTRFSTTGECSPPQHTHTHTHTLTHLPSHTCLSPAMLDERSLRTSQGGRGTNHSLHPQPWASFRSPLGVPPPPGRMRADERHRRLMLPPEGGQLTPPDANLTECAWQEGAVRGKDGFFGSHSNPSLWQMIQQYLGPGWMSPPSLNSTSKPAPDVGLNFHCGDFVQEKQALTIVLRSA